MILVDEDGDERLITWRQLDVGASRTAWLLRREGVDSRALVVIALPSSAEHFAAAIGAWRLGACVLPLNPDMHPMEREKLLLLAQTWRPVFIVGNSAVPGFTTLEIGSLADMSQIPLDSYTEVTPCPARAIGSGGSTGTPKIIIDPKPWAHVPGKWGALSRTGLRARQTQLLVGRLYHNVGFTCGHIGLFEGHTLVIPTRFNAAQTVSLIERHQVQFAAFLPIMMQRIAKLSPETTFSFPSIEGMYHSGGVCADWVKRFWLTVVRPERLWELYGSTEESGITMVSGDEWLQRPGTVGRPFYTDILILDEQKNEVPRGTIGEIHMRNSVKDAMLTGEHWPQDPGFTYVGAPEPIPVAGGFYSVGDLGWLDDDGYLYLADRRLDMIKTGSINVYPAEVEAVLSEHSRIQDVVVIGVPDSEWGQRVHALIQPTTWPASVTVDELDEFCRGRLTPHKVPKSYELFEVLPRDASGKIRRSALKEERLSGHFSALVPATRSNRVISDGHGKTTR